MVERKSFLKHLDSPFSIGERVQKVTGDYHPVGIVAGFAITTKGQTRIVVEHDCGGPFLHIYAPSNLKSLENDNG